MDEILEFSIQHLYIYLYVIQINLVGHWEAIYDIKITFVSLLTSYEKPDNFLILPLTLLHLA